MTDAVPSSSPSSETQPAAYIQVWVESLAQVLGQISGSPLPWASLPQAPAELTPPGDSDLWMVCACSGGLRGEMSLRLPAASILRLAQIFMSEPATSEAELTADHREAVEELLRQVAGLVATALKPSWGEIQLRLDRSPGAPSWPASSTAWLGTGEGSPIALVEVQLSAALAAALRAEKSEVARPAAAPVDSAPCSPEQNQAKLGLLMDVELALTLRFGSRQLLLREVLALNPGAVVDLDRRVEEPVDVLLDGRLVARGEVVVLNGNYGLRVTEVAPASL
jgi:flagellar motor switch protein FliN/FliY